MDELKRMGAERRGIRNEGRRGERRSSTNEFVVE
jgi:hypothetical protein